MLPVFLWGGGTSTTTLRFDDLMQAAPLSARRPKKHRHPNVLNRSQLTSNFGLLQIWQLLVLQPQGSVVEQNIVRHVSYFHLQNLDAVSHHDLHGYARRVSWSNNNVVPLNPALVISNSKSEWKTLTTEFCCCCSVVWHCANWLHYFLGFCSLADLRCNWLEFLADPSCDKILSPQLATFQVPRQRNTQHMASPLTFQLWYL